MNCKPGDLATMVVSPYFPTALGLLVEVLSPSYGRSGYPTSSGPLWQCRAVSGAKSQEGFCMPGDECVIPDAWLRPIRDPGITTEEVKELFSPSPAKESEKV